MLFDGGTAGATRPKQRDGAMAIKVLIIDDSALVRSLLTEIINGQPDMEVVGTAPDPVVARSRIKELNPDVLTLDVEMPRMDGLVFLEKLMRLRPMPVVMVSSLTERNSYLTLHALELGAVDFITKPKVGIASGLQEYAGEIADKIRAASRARIPARTAATGPALFTVERKNTADAVLLLQRQQFTSTEKLIAIGASTGGTEALRLLLSAIPPDSPGIVVTQHMPETFTRAFAHRLNSQCRINVKEAEENDRILPGHAFIAPGNRHLLVERSGADYRVRLSEGPPVNRHRPAVDVLFRSVANCAGDNAIGIILTGMGDDGAAGLLEMKQAGALTFAQDEKSCVVFGMPKEAIALGAVDEILDLQDIPQRLRSCLGATYKRSIRV